MKKIYLVLFSIVFILSCKLNYCNNEFANFINVPDDYTTIQSAIDASINGDTILVEPGIYYENINFKGKNITLASRFIFDENEEYISNTIIDGSNKASAITFENGESDSTKLIGFTIQNGLASNWSQSKGTGGGIICSNASPIFENLNILDNFGSRGGGLYLTNSSSIIRNCQISHNKSDQEGGGAGIYIRGNSNIEIYDTRISHNTCVNDDPKSELWGSLQGAGIKVWRSDLFLSINT